jgi:haloalkane dehalogenase
MTTNDNPSISADFPFESKYIDVLGSKMHYVDEGQGDPILFLHGNPTSSYLWRNIIPALTPFGRCIAVDLIGMGKSDKPDIDYRFVDHVRYLDGFIDTLGLKNITLVVHDWGSALGFYYAQRHEQNVKALAFMEAILAPNATWDDFSEPGPGRTMFEQFRTPEVGWEMIVNQNLFLEQIFPGGIVRQLSPSEMEHYLTPFIDPANRKPVWRWPNEISIAGEPADVTEIETAYNQWLQQTPLPKLLLVATPGALVTASEVEWCRQHLSKLTIVEIGEGLHFIQEDQPQRIGDELAKWYQSL